MWGCCVVSDKELVIRILEMLGWWDLAEKARSDGSQDWFQVNPRKSARDEIVLRSLKSEYPDVILKVSLQWR